MKRFFWLITLVFSFWLTSEIALADETGGNNNNNTPKPLTAEQIAALQDENKRLKEELDRKKSKKPKGEDEEDEEDEEDDDDETDADLISKAKKGRQTSEQTAKETKRIESALTFNIGVDDFVKKNADLLPKDIQEILRLAHKETYDSAIAKSNAIQSAFIQSFFSVQENVDALTKSQKATLDDYLKLTKTGKESKAAEIYENIFEPALETMRKVKKAEELGRSRTGYAAGSSSENEYKDKLMRASRKTHLGEKEA